MAVASVSSINRFKTLGALAAGKGAQVGITPTTKRPSFSKVILEKCMAAINLTGRARLAGNDSAVELEGITECFRVHFKNLAAVRAPAIDRVTRPQTGGQMKTAFEFFITQQLKRFAQVK